MNKEDTRMGSQAIRNTIKQILKEESDKKAQEQLRKIREILELDVKKIQEFYDGGEENEGAINGPLGHKGSVQNRLSALRYLLNELPNSFEIGDIVLDMNGVQWRLVDRKGDSYTIMSTTAFTYAPFSRPSKKYPWGWNNWDESQIKKELNTIWLDKLFGDDKELIQTYYPAKAKLFLLSEEEAGFTQGPETFEYFRGEDEDELDKKRQLKDQDGDETFWWMRSPYPGYARGVRRVGADGSLHDNYACNGSGAVAACVI